jgi:hypothetical protein
MAATIPASLAFLVCRWGGWPGWTPLLLRGFALNPTVTFLLLSDASPAALLPPNVQFVHVTLEALLSRLRSTVGCTLKSLRASGTFASGPSSAKTNDLKPFLGIVFSDLLRPYAWWGYLQEDLLVGDLRAFANEALLARADVICPYLAPLNASGVMMLFRNTDGVNNVWRKSSAVRRVLSDPKYLVFDEWWGALANDDNFARVLGREASAGRLRLHMASARFKWMADDKLYPRTKGATVTTNPNFVACWARGKLWTAAAGVPTPCATPGIGSGAAGGDSDGGGDGGGDGTGGGKGGGRREVAIEVAIVHFSRLKRRPWLATLRLDSIASAVRTADTFAVTTTGVFLPEPACDENATWANRYGLSCAGYEAEGHCADGKALPGHSWALGAAFGQPERACCACGKLPERRARRGGSVRHWWLSGLLDPDDRISVSSAELGGHVRALGERDAALRCEGARAVCAQRPQSCNPRRERTPCLAVGEQPELPCVHVERGSPTAADTLGARPCAAAKRKGSRHASTFP